MTAPVFPKTDLSVSIPAASIWLASRQRYVSRLIHRGDRSVEIAILLRVDASMRRLPDQVQSGFDAELNECH